MGAMITGLENDVITIVLDGKLSRAALSKVQSEGAELIRQHGKVSLLVLATLFTGWEREGDWGDVSFQSENDPFISKIAIVADKKWEGLALIFAGQGVRRPAIEFFAANELEKARWWLAQTP